MDFPGRNVRPPFVGSPFPVQVPLAVIIRIPDLGKFAGRGPRMIPEIGPSFSCRDPVILGYHPKPELTRMFILGKPRGKIFIHFPGCLDPDFFIISNVYQAGFMFKKIQKIFIYAKGILL